MRDLTDDEAYWLAYMLLDPAGWWAHAQASPNIPDPEAALAAKIVRCKAEHEKAGGEYITRSEREAKP